MSVILVTKTKPSPSAAIRATLKHPVVDADGHYVECGPVFLDYLKQVAGPKLVERFSDKQSKGWFALSPEERRYRRVTRPSSWTHPTTNTLDRATAMLPRLFRARMDEFGLDFSVVYSTIALGTIRDPDEEMRRATCRALNVMMADLFRDQAERMTPVASIPANTPEEALAEINYAVETLGMKAVVINSNVRRPIPAAQAAPDLAQYATWVDTLCVDSPYDYDPVWARCVALKLAVTQHSPSVGWGARVTTNHYCYNHVGSFAAAGEAFAKAIVLGGVSQRFPTLNFGFLEGGVAWATELYAGLAGHCGKRNPSVIGALDPNNIDFAAMADLFEQYADGKLKGRADPDSQFWAHKPNDIMQAQDDLIARELANLGITKAADLRPLFEPNFYFGCEADDPLVALGFDSRMNPFGARLKATFSSDIGHWDVPDMTEVLAEAYELVEHELLDARDFEEFVFVNPAMLHAGMNPDFFKGTIVEDEVRKLLAAQKKD
jgi:predicted TIM-barrel fold metal-dependent hydrolase